MSVVIITGAGGLVGAESVRFFSALGFDTVGIDNDMRRYFFGNAASTEPMQQQLREAFARYRHVACDIRDDVAIDRLFKRFGRDIVAVIHAAAQPSHDWAAREPITDFTINANGTLTLLEATRKHASDAVFIFTSTNKVYGDVPNALPLIEREMRWEIDPSHPYAVHGIDETMSVDQCLHSLFGAGKLAADVLVQEYGRYYGLKTGCFRGGCLTGPDHAGAQLHGFLSYLVKCAVSRQRYTVMGYKGKQVRDNIHAYDLVSAFWHFIQAPQRGAVYNMGGSRHSNCSVLEAIALCEETIGYPMNWDYAPENRVGDHIWWISDVRRFRTAYPAWSYRYTLPEIIGEIVEAAQARALRKELV